MSTDVQYTIGALVQANHGVLDDLCIGGLKIVGHQVHPIDVLGHAGKVEVPPNQYDVGAVKVTM